MAAALPAAAQTAPCLRLTEQLLDELKAGSPTSPSMIDATAQRQRRTLTANGCDPEATGYDLEVESLKLNLNLRPKRDDGPAIRLDQLLRLQY
ncbi:MAG: hypothetical protein AAFX65_11420 [Cyanobacteria bacterium J06638_7]